MHTERNKMETLAMRIEHCELEFDTTDSACVRVIVCWIIIISDSTF